MGAAAMRGGAIAVVLLALAGCGPAGVVANSVVKTTQNDNAGDLEQGIRQRFAADPRLQNVKVSVAISNVWRDAFQSRYSVLLAGTVPEVPAREAALRAVRDTIGAEPEAVAIVDRTRVEEPMPR